MIACAGSIATKPSAVLDPKTARTSACLRGRERGEFRVGSTYKAVSVNLGLRKENNKRDMQGSSLVVCVGGALQMGRCRAFNLASICRGPVPRFLIYLGVYRFNIHLPAGRLQVQYIHVSSCIVSRQLWASVALYRTGTD